MTGQEQEQNKTIDSTRTGNISDTYKGVRKLDVAMDLVGSVKDLVAKNDLAKKYKQSSGQ